MYPLGLMSKISFKELLYLISFRKHSNVRIIDRECHAAARASISVRPSPRPLTLAVEIHFPARDEVRLILSMINPVSRRCKIKVTKKGAERHWGGLVHSFFDKSIKRGARKRILSKNPIIMSILAHFGMP